MPLVLLSILIFLCFSLYFFLQKSLLQKLLQKDKEVPTLYTADEYTVTEIAGREGGTHQNISKKLRRIKIF